MRDLLAIYSLDAVQLTSVDFALTLGVRGFPLGTGFAVNGIPTQAVADVDRHLVHVPDGIDLSDVQQVTASWSAEGQDFVRELPVADARNATEGADVHLAAALLKVRGRDFNSAYKVVINNQAVDFTVISRLELLARLPEGAQQIEDVQVLSASPTSTRMSNFAFSIGPDPRVVSGPYKATVHFMKALLTTEGTDVFSPGGPAGNFQKWVGSVTRSDNPHALVAKVAVQVNITAVKLQAQQSIAGLPPEERIAGVQILDFGFTANRPDAVTLTMQVTTLAQQTALFEVLLQDARQAVQSFAQAIQ